MYLFFLFFFFNDTATTEIYTLSLHDALPICHRVRSQKRRQVLGIDTAPPCRGLVPLQQPLVDPVRHRRGRDLRSEEHTSELQSQSNLVCRLLLEKKKKTIQTPRTISRTRRAQ